MSAYRKKGWLFFDLQHSGSFKKTKLFIATIALFIFLFSPLPFNVAYADTVPDQTNRGWICTDDAPPVQTGVSTGLNIQCHDPENPNNVWVAGCIYHYENSILPGQEITSCRICTSDTGEITDTRLTTNGGQCNEGSRTIKTLAGQRFEQAVLDENGIPTGDYIEGNNTSVIDTVFDIGGRLTLQVVATIVWFITQMLVWMAMFVLSLVGIFFNFVVSEFVIEMGKYITAPSAFAVREAWTLVRDLANIAILGGLVATAIGNIIGSEKFSIQKNIARLLIAALLVNFSYFFAGAIIDVSNFTAKAAYEAVICRPSQENCGIASRIAEVTDLDQMSDFGQRLREAANPTVGLARNAAGIITGENSQAVAETATPSANATYNIMLLIFICITTFVFLSAIALLIGRFVVLIFLLITSPIGIAGRAIPILNSYAEEWWKALGNQTMFAPVYFLLAGIALNIMDTFHDSLLSPTADGLLGAFVGTTVDGALQQMVGIIAMFTVAIGFMWAALSTAKKMSAEGAERFQDIYKATGAAFGWMPKAYTGATLGTGKFLLGMGLRETLGRGAHYGGIAYRKFAGANRLDKIPGVSAIDRAIKKQLEKTERQKFFNAAGFHDVHEEVKARGVELGEVEREQEQDGLATGKLTRKQKKDYEDLKAKKDAAKLSDQEEARLEELEAKEAAGTLSADEAKLLADLRAKRSKSGLTSKEEARLQGLQAQVDRGDISEDDKAVYEDLKNRKERGALSAEEYAKYQDLHNVSTKGGYLHQFEDAQKVKERELALGNKQMVNEQEEYRKLQARRNAGETLSEHDDEMLAYYTGRQQSQQEYERLKALQTGGTITQDQAAKLADIESRIAAGEILELRNKNGIETQEAFELRQRGRGKFGRRKTEDAVAYFERMEVESGERPLLSKLQAIEQQLPNDFLKRKYDEHPESLIEYAPMLNSADFVKFMQDPSIRRDIKNQMRVRRHGWYMDKVRELNEKKARGEVMEGTPEWEELNAVPYYYNLKRLSDREEFKDMATSDVGEDLRKIDSFWNGGSLTGAFLGTRGALGAYERRDINTMKREAYYKHQRSLTGAYMLEGADDVYNPDGTLKDSYYIPNKGGSDRFAAAEEAWKNSTNKIKAAQKVIDAGVASPEVIQKARDQVRWHQMILATQKDASGDVRDPGVFVRTYADKEVRATAVRNAQSRLDTVWEDATGDDPVARAQAMQQIRNDEELFVVYNQRQAEKGMQGFMEGKNAEEELSLVSMERTYSPATVIGKSASDLADMMTSNKYDIRFKRSIRTSFIVEKEDAEIQAWVLNPDFMRAFGGYPPKEEIKKANDLRRQKYGPLQGEPGAGPNARMALPDNPADLGGL